MTFKHGKFEDSAVMRSLEKLAQEKGWVKEEPVTKTASAKVDLSVSPSVTENLIRLCAGLRSYGFEKHAAELEDKFFAYKQAQTLYETSPEKGEDLVDRAHPKGSHKLEDVDSDEAVFHTILDKHLKSIKMVEKRPTGKLASSRDVLRAVKIVLAETLDEQKTKLRNSCVAKINAALTAARAFVNKANPELTVRSVYIKDAEWQELVANPSIDKIKQMQSEVEGGISTVKPGWSGGVSDDTWAMLQPFINQMRNNLAGALADRQAEIQLQNRIDSGEKDPAPEGSNTITIPTVEMKSDPIIGASTNLISRLNAFKSIRQVSSSPAAMKWIQEEIAGLQGLIKRFNDAEDTGQVDLIRSNLQAELQEATNDVNDFYQQVSKAGGGPKA